MLASNILKDKGSEVFSVSPDDTLTEAAGTLCEHKVGAAVVIDPDGKPVGVFSERDLAKAIGKTGAKALGEPVSSVMSTALVTAGSAATLDQLMSLMTDKRVRHILIMDGNALVGVVSIGDVVKRKIATAEAEAESLKAYIEGA
ncbi:CBS domain-containing protein [Maricaulaceae bacterium EIL42A08]|nr:CBS domain-containing protein [Maricaulaceae bacterium EIL42A08]